MEKLQRRSDGFAETQSGNLAVFPLRSSGRNTEHKWFDFKRTAVSDAVRVRWRIDDAIVVIEASTAVYLVKKNYARHVTDEEVRKWNDMIDELDLDAPSPAPVPIEETQEQEQEQPAESLLEGSGAQEGQEGQTPTPETPETPETPAEGQENGSGSTGEGSGQTPPPETPETSETDGADDSEEGSEENKGSKRGRKAKEKTEEKGLL